MFAVNKQFDCDTMTISQKHSQTNTMKGAEPMNHRMVEREAFQVVGVRRKCPCGNETGVAGIPEFWGEVNANGTVGRLVPLMNGDIKGLLGITDNYDAENQTIDYWIAAEHRGEGSRELETLIIPKSKWVVFEVRGSAPTAMPEAWRQVYTEWIPSNGYALAAAPAIEAYTDPDPYRDDALNEIWLAIK